MGKLTETGHAGGFMVSEAAGTRSREAVTILSGQNLRAAAVLGVVLIGAAASAADAGNTGDGVMGAVTVGASAQAGVYVLTITKATANAGDFQVVDPQGDVVGVGTVGVEFAGGGLTFTLADGAADFIVGDTFTITVAAGSGKYKEWNPANTDGSQTACAVLWDDVDASGGDLAGVAVVRDAEVNAAELVWLDGATDDNKTAGKQQLAAVGIIAR